MAYRSVGRQATQLALLMGSAFSPVALPAAETPPLVVLVPVAPALMLAQSWHSDLNPASFLVSEKLDGVRAFWDGQVLRFRSGRVIAAPAWFTDALPRTPLDGELWLGRGQFDRLSGIVRQRVPLDAEWHQLHYMIFDLPGAPGPFSGRVTTMVALAAESNVAWLQVAEQERVPDRATLQLKLKQMAGNGAEGLMLHRADAHWAPGRSEALLKLKLVPDEEARVVAQLPGKGRHAGRMGALLLEMAGGQRFALGTGFSDAQRGAPPPLGSVVTYRYRGRTPAGLPRFASFLRVRQPE